MEELYLLSILPPGEAAGKIGPVREELFRRFGMPSARLLPDSIPAALAQSYPEPPKEARRRIWVHSEFAVDPAPVTAGGAVFLPLADRRAWDELRSDPLIAPFRRTSPSGRRQTSVPPFQAFLPYPGIFLGLSSDLPDPRPSLDSMPRAEALFGWRKCSLACIRVTLVPAPGGTPEERAVKEVVWEIFWEVPVVTRV